MCIEVTFLFSGLLKSKKIDLSKTLVRSKIFRLGREELIGKGRTKHLAKIRTKFTSYL